MIKLDVACAVEGIGIGIAKEVGTIEVSGESMYELFGGKDVGIPVRPTELGPLGKPVIAESALVMFNVLGIFRWAEELGFRFLFGPI